MMSAQSLFSKKNIESQQPDTRRGLLEELNLPPELISFIRKNARILQIALICVAVFVLGWIFYDYYAEQQENKGASLLASAMQADSPEQQVQLLENVIREYSRTDAALWSKLELGHIDYQAGRFDAAAARYKETLDSLSSSSPLLPLARLSLAQSYEENGQYDQAIVQYNLLKKNAGFIRQANLALGRIYMAKGEPAQAYKVYEELLQDLADEPDPALKSKIQAKLASLEAAESISPSSPPEENKE
jgi:predicted negative regulator of RcsB-dependent stress response